MSHPFTDRALKVLQLANQEAHGFRHGYVGTEHLLLGLIREGSGLGAHVLKELGIDFAQVRLEIERLLSHPKAVEQAMEPVETRRALPQTATTKKVIASAREAAEKLNHQYVGSEHLLLGLLSHEDGLAEVVLAHCGVTFDKVATELLRLSPELGPATQEQIIRDLRGHVDRTTGMPPGLALKVTPEGIMPSEYKVVSLTDEDEFKWPQALQWPSKQRKQLATTLEQMLNDKSREGWEFVAPCVIGPMLAFIFRRNDKG